MRRLVVDSYSTPHCKYAQKGVLWRKRIILFNMFVVGLVLAPIFLACFAVYTAIVEPKWSYRWVVRHINYTWHAIKRHF